MVGGGGWKRAVLISSKVEVEAEAEAKGSDSKLSAVEMRGQLPGGGRSLHFCKESVTITKTPAKRPCPLPSEETQPGTGCP